MIKLDFQSIKKIYKLFELTSINVLIACDILWEDKIIVSYKYKMAYVQQICDGYNKKSLMGNWYEERLYPEQSFREKQEKKVLLIVTLGKRKR